MTVDRAGDLPEALKALHRDGDVTGLYALAASLTTVPITTLFHVRRDQTMLASGPYRRHSFNPARGGHAPGHLREMLYHWIDEQAMEGDVATTEGADESCAVDRLLGKLWNCTDTHPSDVVSRLRDFGIEAGGVASAVRAIKAKRQA
jgi:hypothetical protein